VPAGYRDNTSTDFTKAVGIIVVLLGKDDLALMAAWGDGMRIMGHGESGVSPGIEGHPLFTKTILVGQ
jgi:hypothetical protein